MHVVIPQAQLEVCPEASPGDWRRGGLGECSDLAGEHWLWAFLLYIYLYVYLYLSLSVHEYSNIYIYTYKIIFIC